MSQRYEYSVGLRIQHPAVDPRAISRSLGMRPRISWRVGEPRVTPVGTLLPGLRRETYWSKTITPGGVKVPSGKVAEQTLTKLVKRLSPHRAFLRSLQRTGGTAQFWLSSYSTSNYSFVFTPSLIGLIHDLGCEVIVDVYPYRQNWGK
jgi:Domain of unknown function (DUF4279)